MRSLNCKTLLLTTAVAVACATQVAQAALLTPGSVLLPASGEPDPSGGGLTLEATTGAVPFTIPGSYSGFLTTDVYSGDATNPFGGLTFVYSITGLVGPNSLGRMSIQGYTGFSTDASYQTPLGASQIAPAYVDRNPTGDVIGFSFIPLPAALDPSGVTGFLLAGDDSAKLVIQTDAPLWQPTVASFIDGGITQAATLGPVVPEPSTIALLVTGLGAIVGRFGLRRIRRG